MRNSKGQFVKGSKAWNIGVPITNKARIKISQTRKRLYKEGKLNIKYGKGVKKPYLTERNIINNPMKKESVRIKASNSMKGRTAWNRRILSPWTTKRNLINNPSKLEHNRKRQRELRKNQIFPKKDSKIEVKIKNFLDLLEIEYYQHKYMNIEHSYQCDFFIPSKNMVVECDGMYWHKYPTGRDIDHIRTKELIDNGFKVLRLWEFDIVKMDLNLFKTLI